MKKIISVVGARPNFMKIAPVYRAFLKYSGQIEHLICHTGQHYDQNMSKVFFEDLELPKPDFYLGIGGGTHAEQTGQIMMGFEKICLSEKPDLVIVVGDVNSTIACTLTACKLHIKTAHVESGLRSFDRNMPEEINRVLTDSISDYLFVTEKSGLEHLKREGISDERVFFTGNVMIDSVVHYLAKAEKSGFMDSLGLVPKEFVLVTMHRPSNVDRPEDLIGLIKFLNSIAEKKKVLFPVHPRTRKNLECFGLIQELHGDVILTGPVGYIDFLSLIKNAELILTDSGGIQEESTYLGVQCVTLRTTTERPSTIEIGTNQMVGDDFEKAKRVALGILAGNTKKGGIPELWDGHSAERIAAIINEKLKGN